MCRALLCNDLLMSHCTGTFLWKFYGGIAGKEGASDAHVGSVICVGLFLIWVELGSIIGKRYLAGGISASVNAAA